jgi:gliding motility-associated-like protein
VLKAAKAFENPLKLHIFTRYMLNSLTMNIFSTYSRLSLVLFLTLQGVLSAQQMCFTNPSMEGNSQAHVVPAPWQACYGSPDTQPGQWGITLPPSNGNTYVSFLHAGNNPTGYKEGMTQLLTPCMVAGNSYTISVDLAYSPVYNTAGPGNCPSSFAIYGGSTACAIAETLYTSGPITHANWQTYNITFTPTANHCWIAFAPYYTGACTGYINILADNFSCIQNALVSTTSTNVSCPGACDGTVTATTNQGTPPFTFSWAPGGATTATVNNLCAGSYTVTVTDANGQTAQSTTVVGSPPAINSSTQVSHISCFGANNGTASVSASGGAGGFTYSWAPSGGTTASVSNLTPGTHVVTITDANGCTKLDSVVVNEPPALVASIAATTPLCPGVPSATLQASATGGTPNYAYVWNNGTTSNTLSNLGIGTYSVSITDANGCTAQNSMTLTTPQAILIASPQTTNVTCFGAANGTAQFNVSGGSGNLSYAWTPAGGTNLQATGLGPGTFTLTVTDQNGCTATDQVNISQPTDLVLSLNSLTHISCFGANNGQAQSSAIGGTPPYQYAWSNMQTGTSATGLTPGLQAAIVMDANGCIDTVPFMVNEPTVLTASTSLTQDSICEGQDFQVSVIPSGGTPTYSYLWNNGQQIPNASILANEGANALSVTVTDANGCAITSFINAVAGSIPNAGFNYTPVCLGNPVQLTYNASNTTGTIVQYAYNLGDGSPLTTVYNPTHTYNAIGPWPATMVVVTDFGCVDTFQQNVLLYDIPLANFSLSPQQGCAPLCPQFTDASTVQNASIQVWAWSSNGNVFANTANPFYCFQNPGTFNVGLTVTSSDGCISAPSATQQVVVFPTPTADFSIDPPVTTMSNPNVNYINQSLGADSYLWTFPNGMTQSAEHTSFSYIDTGLYCVTLLASTDRGCVDTTTKCSTVRLDVNIHIPNTFTPNEDAMNEFFRVYGTGIKSGQLLIFNRWGTLIFSTPDIFKGWSGRESGRSEFVPQGVYVYKVDIIDLYNNDHSFVGKVQVLR